MIVWVYDSPVQVEFHGLNTGCNPPLEDPKGGSNLFSYYRNDSENHQDDTERQPLYTVFSLELK